MRSVNKKNHDVSKVLEYIVNKKLSFQPEDTATHSSRRQFQAHMHIHSTTNSQIQNEPRKSSLGL